LLRLMHEAARRGESPLPAAMQLTSRLFSTEPPALGLERADGKLSAENAAGAAVQDALAMLSMGPSRAEFLNSKSEWEPLQAHQPTSTTLGNAWLHRSHCWRPALADPAFIESVEPLGRTWLPPPMEQGQSLAGRKRLRCYGRELTAALRSDGAVRPTRPFARLLGIKRRPESDGPALLPRWLNLLQRCHPDRLHEWSFEWRGETLMLRCDLSQRCVEAVRDRFGCCLIDPPVRLVAVESETSLRDRDHGRLIEPVADSPLHAWRTLGLIDEDAVPTRRGSVFSLFQHGDGLAIAAALEERDYPVESIVMHIVNLRGPRLTLEPEPGESERLAAACHRAYGTRTYSGYLLHGLPEHYSEGAAEILADCLRDGKRLRLAGKAGVAAGDLDRALLEWLSLLRRIDAAPQLDWSRWTEFKQAAREALKRYPRPTELDQLPVLSHSQNQQPPPHALRLGRF
jgi:hypothetical protein